MRIMIAIMMTAMVIMIMIEIAVSEVATLIIVRLLTIKVMMMSIKIGAFKLSNHIESADIFRLSFDLSLQGFQKISQVYHKTRRCFRGHVISCRVMACLEKEKK